MRAITLLFLLLFSLNSFAGRNLYRSGRAPESNPEPKECETTLTPQEPKYTAEERQAAAELILLLSYDHPLIERWIERAKDVEDIEAILHLVWAYALPIYAEPGLSKKSEKLLAAYFQGRFQFPLDQLRRIKAEHEINDLTKELLLSFNETADWETWKSLSNEHRLNTTDALLNTLRHWHMRKVESADGPINYSKHTDPRTGEKHAYIDRVWRAGTGGFTKKFSVKRGKPFDIFLPHEFAQFQNILESATVPHRNNISHLVRLYIYDHLPLLVQRRIEATTALNFVEPKSWKEKLYLNAPGVKEAFAHIYEKDQSIPTQLHGYLHKIPIEQLKTQLRRLGPLQARIRGDMSLMIEDPALIPKPVEMELHDSEKLLLEKSEAYDLSKQLLLTTPQEIAVKKQNLELSLAEIKEPHVSELQSEADLHLFGQSLFQHLNHVSQALGSLGTDAAQTLRTHLNSEYLSQGGENLLNSAGTLLNAYQAKQSNQMIQLMDLKQNLEKFYQLVDSHLSVLRELEAQPSSSVGFNLAVVERIADMQSILVIVKGQMQTAVDLKIENQRQSAKLTRNILLQIATLNTRRAFKTLTSEDLQAFTENLKLLADSIPAH